MTRILMLVMLAGCASTGELEQSIAARRATMTPAERHNACAAATAEMSVSCTGNADSNCVRARALVAGYCY